MWLNKIVASLGRVVYRASQLLYSVGAGVLGLLMFLTGADITLRYIFNRPISGSLELTEFMMAIIVSFGIAYCAVKRGHVNVELFISRFPQRVQAVINSITGLMSLGMFVLMTWQLVAHTMEQYGSKVTSTVLYIPAYPFVGLVTLGSALLCVVLLLDFFDYLSKAMKR